MVVLGKLMVLLAVSLTEFTKTLVRVQLIFDVANTLAAGMVATNPDKVAMLVEGLVLPGNMPPLASIQLMADAPQKKSFAVVAFEVTPSSGTVSVMVMAVVPFAVVMARLVRLATVVLVFTAVVVTVCAPAGVLFDTVIGNAPVPFWLILFTLMRAGSLSMMV